jgi:hypothetical protein
MIQGTESGSATAPAEGLFGECSSGLGKFAVLRYRIAAALCLTLLCGCRPPAANTLTVNGAITPQVADEFINALNDHITTVVISSGGGDSPSAIRMGREIHKRNLRLVVSKACMSACAHFIFLAAQRRQVHSDSLVVFHNTQTSVSRLAANALTPESAEFRAAVDGRARIEQAFYRELGLKLEFLLQPQVEVRTQCFRYAHDSMGAADLTGSVNDIQFKSDYVGWIPRPEYLESMGIHVEGFWPRSSDDLIHAWAKVFRADARIHILWGGGLSPMSMTELEQAYSKMGLCEGRMVEQSSAR